MQKYGIVVILFAFPIFPRTSFIPSIISGYLSDEIKALNVFVDELLDFKIKDYIIEEKLKEWTEYENKVHLDELEKYLNI